jgi:uncharacterized protein YrrD
MLKGKEVIGRKVITLDNGEQIDTVHDLVFDYQANEVLALLVDEGGWFRAARVVPFENIRSIGEDAVMIASSEGVVSTRDDSRIAELLDSKTGLIGLNLLTEDGEDLGRIADVYFDDHSGKVLGYEATGGLFSDMSSGRTFVPAPEQVNIGTDAAIVPITVAAAMREQEPGGIKGALSSAGSSISGAASTVGESISGAASSVSESVKGVAGNLADATKERQKAFVVGKTASSDVSSSEGVIVATKGDVITPAQADHAEELGLLGSLTTAAGGGALSEAYGSAREGVQGRMEDLSTATKERQREYVVGKTASRDVTAGDGTVIVRQGETVNTLHATLAEEKGALGSLVASATGGSIAGAYDSARSNLGTQPDGESVLGRRVKTDVYGNNRSFIAATGQIVTTAVLERARTQNREAQLVAAVNGAPTGSSVNEGVSAAGASLAAGAASVKEGASGLLERAKSWIGETREKADESMEEKRIENAIGRPVNRVVLNRDDSIILNVGEIITHKAVEQARASDVLGILLGSVSTETPHINPADVRPNETGSAALPSQPSDLKATDQSTTDLSKS